MGTTVRLMVQLSAPKKMALTMIGLAALAAPVLIGVLNAPAIRAQSSPAAAAHWPAWVHSEWFTTLARAEGNPSKDQMRLMMQSLLSDRFRLAVHFETEEVPAYAMTLAKAGTTGPKLRTHSEGPPCPDNITPNPGSERPLDVRRLVPKAGEIFPAECDTLQAVRNQLGLKLVLSKGPIRMLVIDHVEKPSAN
jgi:bla regulator protein blaR1